jgi:hypothetical protein
MAAPTITSFAPATVAGNAGTTTTVTGVAFTGTTAVTVNGAAATFAITNDTTLVVTLPNADPGLATVVITNATGPTTNTTGLTIGAYVVPTRTSSVQSTGVLDTSGTTSFSTGLTGAYGFEEKSLWGGTYPGGYSAYLQRQAKIKAIALYNKRYPTLAIAPLTY